MIEDLDIVPPSFFGRESPEIPWAAPTSSDGLSRLRQIAYGGLCGRVVDVQPDLRSIKGLALFGRLQGLSADGFTGWRDGNGRPIIPLVTTWSADQPPKLVEVRAVSVETARQDYARSLASWPSDESAPSCVGIRRNS